MREWTRIVARKWGGPEVLAAERVAGLPEPGPGEVLLRVEAAGVGYTDTILRRGRYLAYRGGLPATPGYDVVGIVEAIGPGVTALHCGQRVADMPVAGGYGQYLLRPADTPVPVPDGIAPEIAIEAPLMAMTAWQMLTRCAALASGKAILVVGASGAVGRALVALARHAGLAVIGTCSGSNIAQVEALGAHAIDYRQPDLAVAIREAAGGDGVAAAFDAIGGESFEISFQALAPGGLLVGYGLQEFIETGSEGVEAARQIARLTQGFAEEGRRDGTRRRALFYDINQRRHTHPDDYRHDLETLFDLIATGAYHPPQPEVLPLCAAADAHRRIAAGGLRRRLVLDPWR